MRKDDTINSTRSEEANPAAVNVLKGAFFKSDSDDSDDTSEYVTGYVRGGETPRRKRDEVRPSSRADVAEPKKPAYTSFDDDDEDDSDDLSDYFKNSRTPRKRTPSASHEDERKKRRESVVSEWLEDKPAKKPYEVRRQQGTNKMPRSEIKESSFIEDDYNSSDMGEFRERYNSKDLISTGKRSASSPASTAEPQKRRGEILHAPQQKRVDNVKRKPKSQAQGGINPVRVIIAGSVIGLLVLIVVVLAQMNSLRSRLNEAERLLEAGAGMTEEQIAELNDSVQFAQTEMRNHSNRVTHLENFLYSEGYDLENLQPRPAMPAPNQPTTNQNQGGVAVDTTTVIDDGTFEPFYVYVRAGQILARIAREHFNSTDSRYVHHIARENGIADINNVREGQRLRITPFVE
jgi:hypothetical protein